MQKTIYIVLLAACFALFNGSAEARTTKRTASNNNAVTTEHLETHQAAEERYSTHALSYSLGVSSISPAGGGNGALTGFINFTNLDAVQLFLAIPGTTGGFSFGVGGLYKHTLWGNSSHGLHVGGGAGLGTVAGNFAMNLDAIAGVHYTLPNTTVSFHFDGGAVFSLVSAGGTTGGGTTTNFSIGALSNILGASVVYGF
jgi:hypothetical protein